MLYFDSRCHATDKLLDHHSSTPRELRKKSRSAPPRAWFQIRTTWSTSRDAATTLSLPSLRSSLRRFTLAAILLLGARAPGVRSCRVGSQAGLAGVCFVPCVDQDPVRSRKSAIIHRKRTEQPPPIKSTLQEKHPHLSACLNRTTRKQGIFHLRSSKAHKQNSPLRPIRILLRIHLLDADLQPALFREAHVFLLHVLLAAVRQVVAPQVDLVAEVGGAADDGEEDYEREEGGEAHDCWLL
jgi:hypothetical protein